MYYWRTLPRMQWICVFAVIILPTVTHAGRPSMRQLCISEGEQRGRCVPVKQCESVLTTIRKELLTNEDIQYLYGSECGRTVDGKALVCCPQSSILPGSTGGPPNGSDTTIRVNAGEERPAATSSGSSSTLCGFQSEVQLANHTIGHHPWTVLIHYSNQAHDSTFNCSGTLIAAQYVLTAASCVDEREAWSNLKVRLGEWDLESSVDCVLSLDNDDLVCADPSYDLPVAEVILHEAFTGRQNDIALLKLSQAVAFSDWVFPICLPESSVINETATYSVAGWNQNTCDTSSRRYKLLSSYSALNQTACQQHLPSVAGTSYNFVCVDSDVQAIGEAGGGLTGMKTISRDPRRPVYEIVGVLSSLSSCANFDGISIYTRVGQYIGWIESKLEP
uniref:CLIP domain-containing serine protease n=1 Tax=Anopheles minimus TaxID=112268 RepID=A0A182VQP9_9DIPT